VPVRRQPGSSLPPTRPSAGTDRDPPARAGRKVTSNFQATLPPSSSGLAQQATKDPHVFNFLDRTDWETERDLECQLLEHVEQFLLELGRGFTFVGRPMRLNVSGDGFFPNLCSATSGSADSW
jgi:hypothetical protein